MKEWGVTDLGRYILEEWAEDYHAGRLERREFLRRVLAMAGSQAAALAVLASLGERAAAGEVEGLSAQTPPPQQTTGVTVPPDDPAIQVATVRFRAQDTEVMGYLARPRQRPQAPGLVVVHENRGLVEHIKDVARRFAKVGYVALAVDLASHEGGTDRFSDPAQVTALLGRTPVDRLVDMLVAAVEYLRGQPFVRADRLGAVGWCFGGGMVWRLATRSPELRAAVPFYGPNPPLEDVPRIRAAVLGIYGERDERINRGLPALREALQRAGVVHEIVVYPGADHAFFNDTGPRYHPQAARLAWERAVEWFRRYLES